MVDALLARSAFQGLLPPASSAHGVFVTELATTQIATLACRPAQLPQLVGRLKTAFGLELRPGPNLSRGEDLDLVGMGPGVWLATAGSKAGALKPRLEAVVGDVTNVVDQSGAYGVLSLAGPDLLEALSRIIPLDLHPTVFTLGDAASTLSGHIPVILWRVSDQIYVLAVARSYAASFWRALAAAATPFGFGQPPTMAGP